MNFSFSIKISVDAMVACSASCKFVRNINVKVKSLCRMLAEGVLLSRGDV